MRLMFYVCVFSFIFLPITTSAGSLTGKIVKVLYADTVTLMTEQNEMIKVRLYGIDTPKCGQPHCQKAKRFTFALLHNKEVEVITYDIDENGCTVGVVLVDDMNANEEIIRVGCGWQYRDHCTAPFCSKWLQLEKDAEISGVGLWYENDPVPPWEWREKQQEEVSVASAGSS